MMRRIAAIVISSLVLVAAPASAEAGFDQRLEADLSL